MSKERLVTFMDAVLAIIMTILVLDLDRPDSPDLVALWALREKYFAYALSFFWLGALWISTNLHWKGELKVSMPVLWWTVIMLFFASLIPYVTDYAGENFYNAFAQGFYGSIVLLVSISHLILSKFMADANRTKEPFYNETVYYNRTLIIDIIFKLVGIILAVLIYPPINMLAIIIAAFLPAVRPDKNAPKA